MNKKSRRNFIKQSLSLFAVATAGPTTLLARIEPTSWKPVDKTTVAGTYTLKVSDFPTQVLPGGIRIGLSEVGDSIKLTTFEELTMNPDHCERSGKDGNNYPIAVVRVKESGEDAFRAVSTWCPHNNESQLDYFNRNLGEDGLFVCSQHEFSSFTADGTWVPPNESPYPDAPTLDEFFFNLGPDGKPHLTSFGTSFDGNDTLIISDVLCECEECAPSSVDDIEEGSALLLEQNFPNPATQLTVFSFVLPRSGRVKLSILSVDGKTVAVPVNRTMEGGKHLVDFNVKELPSGSYFFKLETPFGAKTRRMTVVQ